MRKFSRKQISAVGLAVMMSAQGSVMAAEVSQEETTVVTEFQTEESESAFTEESVEEPTEENVEPTLQESTEQSTQESAQETETESNAELEEVVDSEKLTEEVTEESTEAGYEAENSDIAPLAAMADGWQLDEDGNYSYIKDGELVKDCVMQINGVYYGFDAYGTMYAGRPFQYEYRGEYRAKADGSLYVSEWYQDNKGKWYYYDEEGVSVRYKEKNIDGKIYYFTIGLSSNILYYANGKEYLADQNGERVQTKGWYQQNGGWYYVKEDGSLYKGILNDGGYTYQLNPVMLVSQPISIEYKSGDAYTIDENGHVSACADGFYEYDSYGYYVRDGKIVKNEWKYSDGKWYYFGGQGIMVQSGSGQIDGKYYYLDSDGAMVTNGWNYGISGEWHYAYPSGELAVGDTWINGKEYHFNSSGTLQTGIVQNGDTYTLYGDDGDVIGTIDAEGWNFVDGNYYYLKSGSLLRGNAYQIDGAWYEFDYEARMRKNEHYSNRWYSNSGWAYTGWILKAGTWYYADLQTAQWYKGFQTVNGVEYYFDEITGEMLVGEKVIDGKVVTTDASGAIISNQIAADGWSRCDGEYYYYKKGHPYTGWVGSYYVLNGLMQRNTIVIDEQENPYWVNEYGVYQTNSWVDNGNSYAKANGILAQSEWVTIGGKTYYFSGTDKNTESFYMNGYLYVLDADGAYISTVTLQNGWNLVNGEYYYQAGNRLVSGKTEVDGTSYYFVNGKMMTNMASKDDVYSNRADHCFGADGKMLTGPGWKSINGNWYYVNNKGQYAKYWAEIDGKKYYFKAGSEYAYEALSFDIDLDEIGIMCTGYRVIDHKLYYFAPDGVCQGICGPKDGWYNANGTWYFMRGGKVSTGIASVNGADYMFADNGRMYANTIAKTENNSLRYVNADGIVVTTRGWRLTSDGYIFVQQGGALCTGIHTIDGVTYMFGSDGILQY